jgi:hypothetical protein
MARIAAKLRFRERWKQILTVAMVVAGGVLGVLVPFRPTPPRVRSRTERDELLRSGTCIVRESDTALLGKVILQLPPSRIPAGYVIEDPRVRSTRTVLIDGTRRVPCSSTQEP